MIDRKLSLNALRAFESAARRGSLTAAAAELRVSVAAVSRHVALLEAHLGCTLLARRRTGVELTGHGRLFFPKIGEAFETIEAAERQLAGQAPGGTVHVRMYTSFMLEWFAARLPRFRATFPAVDLKLHVSTDEADFDCDRVDLSVTAQPPQDDRLHHDELFGAMFVPVCSPAVIERAREDGGRLLLCNETLLHERREGLFWHRWFAATGHEGGALERGLQFDAATLAYQAARVGAGVALAQLFYVAADLRAGRLVAAFPTVIRVPFVHRLACRRKRRDEPLLGLFRHWLLDEVRASLPVPASLGLDLIDG